MISVIIPAYNREKTIAKAINSVLNQTYEDIECIVVDDCSTDNTENVVKAINDSRLKYYKLENNSGACFARNYGIEKSLGEYIAFQDSDDEWLENNLEKQLEKLKEVNADLVFGRLKLYNDNNTLVKRVPNIKKKSGFITYNELLKKSIISTQTILAKKEVFRNIKFDNEMPRFQDWDLFLRVIKENKVYYNDIDIVNVYQQKDSISKQSNKGLIALDKIFNKNKEGFFRNKDALANYYISLGECKKKNKERYFKVFIKSLKTKFSIINLLKIIKISIKK